MKRSKPPDFTGENAMKRFCIKSRRGLLLCCVTASLVPLSVYAQQAGKKVDIEAPTQQQAGQVEKAGEGMRDTQIHKTLESRLAQNEHLRALSIDTDVENGKVYLRGEVRSGAQRALAAEVAGNVDGVTGVQNDLVVNSADPPTGERLSRQASDAALTAQVKSRLMLSNNTAGLAIDVHTENNIVTLRGTVSSATERELAGLIAGNTEGVTEVRNELQVRPD